MGRLMWPLGPRAFRRALSRRDQYPRLNARGPTEPAFTLTEMLVVLVIIGLLVAIVGPRLFTRLDDAKFRTARLQIANLATAIDLFRIDVGRLPTREEGLGALLDAPAGAEETWVGPYLARNRLPDDPWGRPYAYESDGEGYHIVSLGADGREGGSGANRDVASGEEKQRRAEPVRPADADRAGSELTTAPESTE